MIHRIVAFCLRNRLLTLALTFALLILGAICFRSLPIDAYPDIDDVWFQVIAQWPGHAAEEMERLVTVPVEISMNACPHHTLVRSDSEFALSVVTVYFDESTDPFTALETMRGQLAGVNLPAGVVTSFSPMTSSCGQVLFYTLRSDTADPTELKTLNDWEIMKRLLSVPDVVDDSSLGGYTKQYQVNLDPTAMANYRVAIPTVLSAIAANNQNTGGGFITHGQQDFNVRAIGTADTVRDIGAIVLGETNGTPIYVRNVADVGVGHRQLLGDVVVDFKDAAGRIHEQRHALESIVSARKGSNFGPVIAGLEAEIRDINAHVLPPGVRLVKLIDRGDLIRLVTRTVRDNLGLGMILVVGVLLFMMGNLRGAFIVAATIPFALLFSSTLLDLKGVPANLLSLGALDFGMVVDGAVVMVENIFRHLENDAASGRRRDMLELIVQASAEVERPIVFAIGIIILAYLPIFSLQRVEGRLFHPMAWTVAFALLGSMVFVVTAVPVLCFYAFKGGVREWRNPVLARVEAGYGATLEWCLGHKNVVVGVSAAAFVGTLWLALACIGSEFLPHLDEGNLWIHGTFPNSVSYAESMRIADEARRIIASYPETETVFNQIGRPDDGTAIGGFFDSQYSAGLKPKELWRPQFHGDKDRLIASINARLQQIPGTSWLFSQAIEDGVGNALTGTNGDQDVELFGDDLPTLDALATQVAAVMRRVPGMADVGVFRELAMPEIDLIADRDKIARYGLNVSDVQTVLQTAVGGEVPCQVVEGEKTFDIMVRYQKPYRDTLDAIRRVTVTTPDGFRVPLDALCAVQVKEGASDIYRKNLREFIPIRFSVRGRDLGGTVRAAQAAIAREVRLPKGVTTDWVGEYQSEVRAERRLALVVPLTILGIFALLYLIFDSAKWAAVVLTNVMMARIGGVLALVATGTYFSVSSGIGFLALFGVSVQTGVFLVSYIHQMRLKGLPLRRAVLEGSRLRLRPIMMTALVATLGLVPAAMSHAIGSDSQRPMAIVIVGGLLTDLLMGFYLLPIFYEWAAREGDELKF